MKLPSHSVAGSAVPGFEVTTMYGISAPAKTPRVRINRLHAPTAGSTMTQQFDSRARCIAAMAMSFTLLAARLQPE